MEHPGDSTETKHLLVKLSTGSAQAFGRLLDKEREYLRRLVDLRLEPGLRGRVDPSDVVQETLIVASDRIQDFLERRPSSFRLWLRQKALERLVEARRRHQAAKRSYKNEIHLTDASSMLLANPRGTRTPSQILQQKEEAEQIRQAVQALAEGDREVLLLRHVEGLSNNEIAEVLGVAVETASRRYGRAVRRLAHQLLSE